jgi:hypothetical protein
MQGGLDKGVGERDRLPRAPVADGEDPSLAGGMQGEKMPTGLVGQLDDVGNIIHRWGVIHPDPAI